MSKKTLLDITQQYNHFLNQGKLEFFLLAQALDFCKDPEEQAKLKKTFLEKVVSHEMFGYFPDFNSKDLDEELVEEAIRLKPSLILSLKWERIKGMSNLKAILTHASKQEEDVSLVDLLVPSYFIEKNPEFWFRIKCTIQENHFWGIKKP